MSVNCCLKVFDFQTLLLEKSLLKLTNWDWTVLLFHSFSVLSDQSRTSGNFPSSPSCWFSCGFPIICGWRSCPEASPIDFWGLRKRFLDLVEVVFVYDRNFPGAEVRNKNYIFRKNVKFFFFSCFNPPPFELLECNRTWENFGVIEEYWMKNCNKGFLEKSFHSILCPNSNLVWKTSVK